jgi:Sulfotransferase family
MRAPARAAPLAPMGADGGIDMPPPPPECPKRWQTGPPDFVGVGVQRSGTTRWCSLIFAHPEILRPHAGKELHYFDRFYAGGFDDADIAGYHAYFPRDGRVTGEWTPMYASAPWIPPLLAKAAPAARLLMLVRDPVERYLSGLELDTEMARKRGTPLSRFAPLEAFSRGFYHAQLHALLRHFDRSQLLVLQYERCTKEPQEQLRRTYEFLGLSDLDFTPDLEKRFRAQPEKPTLDEAARAAYVNAYADDVLALASEFGEIDLSLWPNFAHLAALSR